MRWRSIAVFLLASVAPLLASAEPLGPPLTRFIVRMRTTMVTAASESEATAAVSRALTTTRVRSLSALTLSPARRLSTGGSVVSVNTRLSESEVRDALDLLATDPLVASAQVDRLRTIERVDVGAPDDPLFGRYQWHLRSGDGAMETVGRDAEAYANHSGIDALTAWTVSKGAGVTVAVIDTGLTHHPDLDLSLGDAGYDFISSGYVSGRADDARAPGGWDLGDWTSDATYSDPYIGCVTAANAEDSSWHGTHVAGTVAELANNGIGMAGVAPGARILPIRAIGHCGGYESDIADAIEWASGGHVDGVPDNTHPAQVINLSLGGGGTCTSDTPEGIAIADATARGATVVVAAGNDNAYAANHSPASCPGALTVGAVGISGHSTYYSNFGSTVAIAAPGGGGYAGDASSGALVDAGFVWSTINTGPHEPNETPNGYAYGGMAGTSQATPHVSGTVAMMIAASRAARQDSSTPAQLRSWLISSSRRFPVGPDHYIGAGIVDANAAVHLAAATPVPLPTSILMRNVPVTGVAVAPGGSVGFAIDLPPDGRALVLRAAGGSGDVTLYAGQGHMPAEDGADASFVARHLGNAETIAVSAPAPGRWYLRVVGVLQSANVTVVGSFVQP